MQKRNTYIQKHLTEKEIQSTAECQSYLFYTGNWGDGTPLLLGSYSSPGGYHTCALYRHCIQDERAIAFLAKGDTKTHYDSLEYIKIFLHTRWEAWFLYLST